MLWRMTMVGLLAATPVFAQTVAANDWSPDEAVLREQRLPTHGLALLDVLRARTPTPEMTRKFGQLVWRLNADHYSQRTTSTTELLNMGLPVRRLVENHLLEKKADPEKTARLRYVLGQLPVEKDHAIVMAAARLIARDKPADSLSVLLDFVPHATNEAVRQEIQQAINAVAFVGKNPHAMVLSALKDSDPAKQAAAAEALLRVLGLSAKDQIASQLRTNHPLVRYQLGISLVEKHDKSGLPFVIDSLTDTRADRAENALELLYRVASDSAPTLPYRGTSSGAEVRDAWIKWHQQHHDTLDLVKALAKPEFGYTLICCTGHGRKVKNTIFELGVDKSVRWEFDGPRYPIDMQIIRSNRLLLAEYFDRRVTERDFKGNILWQIAVPTPIACQRLPNGHTFIATRQNIMIVDRAGRELLTCFPQNTGINTARRLRNGQMIVVTSGGRCHLLDPQGVELKSFQMGRIHNLGGSVDVLPNGRVLAPQYNQNCIVEFDWQGNKHWRADIQRPISATRLSNGHTLVTCSLDHRVVELDADGKEVWSYQTEGRPFRALRR